VVHIRDGVIASDEPSARARNPQSQPHTKT
jgi:hypothetical protein